MVFSTSHQSEDESMASSVVRLRFAGANPSPVLEGLHQQPGVANFFIGNDPIEWRTSVPTYGAVAYRGLYPGIDLVYLGKEGHLESEFVLAPGADPGMIQLAYSGLKGVSLREDGALVLQTEFGELVEAAPILYQEIGKQRVEVEGSYQLLGGGQVGFQVGSYNASYPLVIDPSIEYSTYLGGVEVELGDAIAVDNAGFAYVTGVTLSIGFPTTTGVLQGPSDAFVAKLDTTDATGAASLVYSTYLGGNSADQGGGIAVDGSGNAYVTGFTASSNFPTANPLDSSLGGVTDAFVAKLNNTGSTLVYSTYLGGSGDDRGGGIAVDAGDGMGVFNAYVIGTTSSPNLPTVNFFQGDNAGNGDTFVAKINDVTLDSIMVSIDIKPGSDPNCFNNNGNGVIPVAILGDANFDASLIDSGTVALEGLAVRAVGKSNKLLAHIKDVNTDGFDDLVVQIEDSDGVFLAGDTVATLTATLIDLTPIEGSDALCIVP